MKKSHILLVAALCMVSAGLGALTVTLDSTSQAGSGQLSPPNNVDVNHSYDLPAIIFIDADGNQMTPMEAQEFLNKLDYRDNDGNKIKVDGAPGTSTWQGWCKYVGDCHGSSVMSLFGVD